MDAGEFGRMNLAQLNFGSYKEYGDLTNRFYNRNLAGGAMLDIGVYALSVMRLFMASQPAEVVSLGNTCETGVDVAGGIVCRNAEQQLGVVSLTLHSKQPKRSVISFDKCYIEVNDYPRADHATIVWTADGRARRSTPVPRLTPFAMRWPILRRPLPATTPSASCWIMLLMLWSL